MTKSFFLPVNTGFFTSGNPNTKTLEFYSARSKHGLYCSIVGNVVVANGHSSNSSCGIISENNNWKLLADAISNSGAKPGIQLASTWQGYIGQRSFVSKPLHAINYYADASRNITDDEVSNFFNNLTYSTELAISKGFRHIQIHAAHGYLLSLLLDPSFSNMHDYVIKKLINWNTATKNEGVETSIRVSWESGFDEKVETNRQKQILSLFNQGFDFIDLSAGYYNLNKHLIYPIEKELIDRRLKLGIEIAKSNPYQNFISSGRIDLNNLQQLPANLHVGICRDLIANQDFLLNKKQMCANHFKCHYFSTGKNSIDCGIWEKSLNQL